MKKHYKDSNILFLESRGHSKSLQIYIDFFTIYGRSNIGKNFNLWKDSQ